MTNPTSPTGGLDAEQLRNAAIITQVGLQLGASQRDIQIALITAYTESQLRNLNYGDRDSLGLFQQRSAWGSAAERMDPVQSARMFFQGGQGGQRGLLDFKDRNQMGMGEAAQAVQVSAFPDRYTRALGLIQGAWPDIQKGAGQNVVNMDGQPYTAQPQSAVDLNLPDATPNPQYPGLSSPDFSDLAAPTFDAVGPRAFQGLGAKGENPLTTILSPATNQQLPDMLGQTSFGKGIKGWRKGVVDAAQQLLGTPYVWGGSNPQTGLDCSGLVQYVFGQMGYNLPRVSYQQANAGTQVALNQLKPGDLVAWDNNPRNPGADHIAIYIGNGQIIEAPKPGLSVRVRTLGQDEGAQGVHLNF